MAEDYKIRTAVDDSGLKQLEQSLKNLEKAFKGLDEVKIKGPATLAASFSQFNDYIKNIKTLNVSLDESGKAVSKFQANLTQAQQNALRMDWGKKGVDEMSKSLTKLGKDTQWTGRQLMIGLSLPILGGADKAINQFIGFSSQITKVKQNLTSLKQYADGTFRVDTGSSVESVNSLEKSLTNTAHAYAMNRTMLAGVAADLSAMGIAQDEVNSKVVKAKDELSAYTEMAAKFAFSSNIGPDKAKEAIANLLNTYVKADPAVKTANDRVEKTNYLMNILAAVGTKVRVPMGDLVDAMPSIADASKQFNLGFAQTIALMAAGTHGGIDASMAATALGQAYSKLSAPSKLAQEGLAKFNVGLKDSSGNLKPGLVVFGELGKVMKKASPAEVNQLFSNLFNPRQAKTMVSMFEDLGNALDGNVNKSSDLMNALGAVGQANVQSILAGANAEKQVSSQTKTALQQLEDEKVKIGQTAPQFRWKQMTSDIQTAFSELGKNLAPVIGPIIVAAVTKIKELVAWFDKLPAKSKAFMVVGAGVLALLGPVLMLSGTLITSVGTITGLINKVVMMGKGLKVWTDGQIALKGGMQQVETELAAQGKILVPINGKLTEMKATDEQLADVKMRLTAAIREENAAYAEQNALTSQSASGVESQIARDAEQAGLIKKPKPLNLNKELGKAYKVGESHLDTPTNFNYAKRLGAAYAEENATSRVHRDMIRQEIDQQAREHITAKGRHLEGTLTADERQAIFNRVKKRVDLSREAERAAIPAGGSISGLYADVESVSKGHLLPRLSRTSTFSMAGEAKRGLSFESGSALGRVGAPFAKLGGAAKDAGKSIADHMLHPITSIKKLGDAVVHPISSVKKLTGAFKSLVTGGPLAELVPELAPILTIAAPIALVAGAVFLIFKNWKHVQAGLGDGIKAIKKAFGGMIDAVISPFKSLFNIITGGSDKSGKAANGLKEMWKGVGTLLNGAMHGLAAAFSVVGAIAKPIVQFIANDLGFVIKVIEGIILLMTGKWGAAWDAFKGAAAFAIKTILQGLLLIPELMIKIISGIVHLASKIPGVGHHFKGMDNALKGFSKTLQGVPNQVGDMIDKTQKAADTAKKVQVGTDKNKAKKSGQEAGKAIADGAQQGFNDAVNQGGGGGGVDPSEMLSALKSRVDKVLGDMVQDAIKAYDAMATAKKQAFDLETKTTSQAMENQKKAQDEAIDSQIKAIDDLQKARDDALREEEYRTKRLELLQKQQEQEQNYLRDRTLALYEGRVDDARNLDLEHIKNTIDGNKELKDMDQKHNDDLLKQQEDEQKEMLSKQKQALDDQYTLKKQAYEDQRQVAKDALDKELSDRKQNLEDQLQALKDFTPRSAAELQARIDKMHGLLVAEGVDWGGQGKTARELWSTAISDAKKDVEDKAYWSGKGQSDGTSYLGGLDAAAAAADQANQNNNNPSPFAGASAGGSVGGIATPFAGTSANASASGHSGDGKIPTKGPFHSGGFIGDPSSHPSDVNATLQSGEYVIQRSAVSRFGSAFLDALNAGVIPKFHTGGLVGGVQAGGRNIMAKWADAFMPPYMTKKWMEIQAHKAAKSAKDAAGTQGIPGAAYTGPGLGVMSMQDVVNLARSVGFQGANANLAAAIATAESGRNPMSHNPIPPDDSYGLWQINMLGAMGPARAKAFGLKAYSDLYDPKVNALAALAISGGHNWSPWSTYTNGAYKQFLAEAMRYDSGGLLNSGKIALNTSGGPEFVLTKQMLSNLAKGVVPMGRLASMLTASTIENVQNSIQKTNQSDSAIIINVENFIGQKEWFERMMTDYNVKVQPRIDRGRGNESRVIK